MMMDDDIKEAVEQMSQTDLQVGQRHASSRSSTSGIHISKNNLLKIGFNALRRHKYSHPIATINFMQKLFNAIKDYKGTDLDHADQILGNTFRKKPQLKFQLNYLKRLHQMTIKWNDRHMISKLLIDITSRSIQCFKYNYSLDKIV